jgi:hypothetical protein
MSQRSTKVLKIAKLYTANFTIENIEKMLASQAYSSKTMRFLKRVLDYKIDKYEWSIINPPTSPPKKKPKLQIEREKSFDPDNLPEGYQLVKEIQKCGGKGQTQIITRVEKIHD